MNPLSMAELGILDWIAAHCHNSFWDAVMPFITGLGDQGILWIPKRRAGNRGASSGVPAV